MPRFLPTGRAAVRPAVAALVVLVLGTACGGAASPARSDAPASIVPSGSAAAGDCATAPAPPSDQEGWTTAAQEPSVFPVIVNSPGSLTCGENRLVFTFLDDDNRPVGAPERTATVALFNLGRDGGTAAEFVDSTFIWGIEGERGFYVANVTFPEAGRWGIEFSTSPEPTAPEEQIRMTFDVSETSPVVRVGDPAVPVTTPTAADVGGDLARLSTDDDPDPALYELSVDAAIEAGRPFVLVFATPKFCVSAQCGPTLDVVKPLAAEFPSVAFLHVEPYELTFDGGSLQPVRTAAGDFVPVEAVEAWGLLSEPWIFVVDDEGVVQGSFEGAVGPDELREAIAAVSG